ncbi:hypothetical protein AAC387_Pa10g1075 [Persea americana]
MEGKKPYLAGILIQSIYAGMYLFSKAALNDGMNSFVFTFYRQAAAAIFLVPVAIACERKGAPPLSSKVLFKMFVLALFGICLSLNAFGLALRYTSSSLAAAATNLLPAITFFIALLHRMEVVKLRSLYGIAKVVGIILSLGGAATIALYKGPHLKPFNHHHPFGNDTVGAHHAHSSKSWIEGSFIMLAGNILWGLWLVMQGPVLKEYPSKLLFTTLQCVLSTVQSFLLAVAFERDISQWKLGLDVRLTAVAYSGIVVTGVTFYLQTWCIEKKGPVFLAMFTPLALIITTICSTFLLGELISLGSVLGGLLMVGGLYSVLWGKHKEQTVDKSIADENKECSGAVTEEP